MRALCQEYQICLNQRSVHAGTFLDSYIFRYLFCGLMSYWCTMPGISYLPSIKYDLEGYFTLQRNKNVVCKIIVPIN